jgi:hypothetical protein
MAVPKLIQASKGLWRGKSQLNLPWLPPEKRVTESDSRLHIETDERNLFATITYDWRYDERRQEGTILACQSIDNASVEFAWVDSWHQSSSIMSLKGTEAEDGPIKVKGSFTADSEVWGWTISFLREGEHLALNMENITPKGDVTWAVKALYSKA